MTTKVLVYPQSRVICQLTCTDNNIFWHFDRTNRADSLSSQYSQFATNPTVPLVCDTSKRTKVASLREWRCNVNITAFRYSCLLTLRYSTQVDWRLYVGTCFWWVHTSKSDSEQLNNGNTADIDLECFACDSSILRRHIVFPISWAMTPRRFFLLSSTVRLLHSPSVRAKYAAANRCWFLFTVEAEKNKNPESPPAKDSQRYPGFFLLSVFCTGYSTGA